MQIRRIFIQLCIGTLCLQTFLVIYLHFAPWETLNADLENWFEEKAFSEIESKIDTIERQNFTRPAEIKRKKKAKASIVHHTVKKGENLSTIWQKYAGNLDRFSEVKSAFQKAGLKALSLKTGEKVEVALKKKGNICRLKKTLDDGSVVVVKNTETNGYTAYSKSPKILQKQKVVTATIYDSFVRTANYASIPYEVVDELVDLFGHRIDFSKDLQAGDTLSVVYDEKKIRGKEKALSVVIQAASLKLGDKLLAIVRYNGRDGKSRYYDEKGKLLGDYFLRYPVKFTRISSVFSKARMHPILGVTTTHPGVDLAASTGTPVRSIADGFISFAGYSGGAGNMIEIKHGGNVKTIFMHLSKFAKGIKQGARVQRGQIVGAVGSTGLSTGPHLDYRLSINGKYVNPLNVQLPQIINNQDTIPPKLLQATLTTLMARHENMVLAQRELGLRKARV
ncbi:MAG: peptidoglycan DD-metalloendopeptidase family protein [SAR324 cluster bacterium]|uniref:Peptidoglycan DD-metalloendopeptidase family protein n=1 Tax=SAR324 cluster bacterium TaxID=2024889 RepID=A0A7X9IK29_9DELT|nr:peptidoglycan DD-metalloendopeptidase family protein [SAR324 cluster bacterium]